MPECEGQYQVGTVVRSSATMTDITGVAADPTAIDVSLLEPDGTQTDYVLADPEVVNDGVGLYHFDVTCDQNGYYEIRWAATGNSVDVATQDLWHVHDTDFVVP